VGKLKLGLAVDNKHKKVFSILIIMVKAHNKSRSELSAMKVAELKTLIRKHNLDNAIGGYSAMKKADLVDALVKHSGGEKAAAKPAPKKRKLEIVEEKKETPAERAARRAKPRVIKSKPIAKSAPLKKPAAKKAREKTFDDESRERDDIKSAIKSVLARNKKPAAPKKPAKKPAKKPVTAGDKFRAELRNSSSIKAAGADLAKDFAAAFANFKPR